jgi:hypothetical protein
MSDDFLNEIQDHIQKKVIRGLIQNNSGDSATVDLLSKEAFPTLPSSTSTRPVPVWKPTQSLSVTERFEIPSSMLVIDILIQARQQLGKLSNTSQVCKDVMLKFKSKIEYSTNRKSESITFLVSGSAEAVKQSKKNLLRLLSAKVDSISY